MLFGPEDPVDDDTNNSTSSIDDGLDDFQSMIDDEVEHQQPDTGSDDGDAD